MWHMGWSLTTYERKTSQRTNVTHILQLQGLPNLFPKFGEESEERLQLQGPNKTIPSLF